jgi:hypothetical protein
MLARRLSRWPVPPWRAHAYLYVCVHVYVHVYAYVYICIYVRACMYVCMYIYIYIYIYIYTRADRHAGHSLPGLGPVCYVDVHNTYTNILADFVIYIFESPALTFDYNRCAYSNYACWLAYMRACIVCVKHQDVRHTYTHTRSWLHTCARIRMGSRTRHDHLHTHEHDCTLALPHHASKTTASH